MYFCRRLKKFSCVLQVVRKLKHCFEYSSFFLRVLLFYFNLIFIFGFFFLFFFLYFGFVVGFLTLSHSMNLIARCQKYRAE